MNKIRFLQLHYNFTNIMDNQHNSKHRKNPVVLNNLRFYEHLFGPLKSVLEIRKTDLFDW